MNREMFENTVLAILKESPGLGSIQVRKALCIADAVHNSLHRESITGVKYIKERMGPVPDNDGHRCLIEMELARKIKIVEEPIFQYTQNSYYAIVEPNYSVFTESQIDIINYAAKLVRTYPAGVLSAATHDAEYNKINMREEIPLEAICSLIVTGSNDTEPFTEEEREDIRKYFEANGNPILTPG